MGIKKKIMLLAELILVVLCVPSVVSPSINVQEIQNNPQPKNAAATYSILWGSKSIEICNATGEQGEIVICPDGSGGAIIAWYDDTYTATWDIYAQRIDKSGNVKWAVNGTAVCNLLATQDFPAICPTGDGGAIVAWEDQRKGNFDIYAQRLDGNGNGLWVANGTVICNATGDQQYVSLYSDGHGGAILAWIDHRNGNEDIYAQRISGAGIAQWIGNGTVICNRTAAQSEMRITGDANDGAILTWHDTSAGTEDIYSQRVNTTGVTQWTGNGTVICNATQDQKPSVICGDNNGNAYIAWGDYRSGSLADVYAQKINLTGNTQWDDNGTIICNEVNKQDAVDICYDFNGGAIVSWYNTSSSDDLMEIYAQRISSTGNTLWDDNGTLVSGVSSYKESLKIESDLNGGAIIVWLDDRNLSTSKNDIYAQHIDLNGNLEQATDTVICNAPDNQNAPVLCTDGNGGAIIAWVDNRNNNYDIYAQRFGIPDVTQEPPGDDDSGDDDKKVAEIAIPFGGMYLVFMCFGVIMLVVKSRRRINKI